MSPTHSEKQAGRGWQREARPPGNVFPKSGKSFGPWPWPGPFPRAFRQDCREGGAGRPSRLSSQLCQRLYPHPCPVARLMVWGRAVGWAYVCLKGPGGCGMRESGRIIIMGAWCPASILCQRTFPRLFFPPRTHQAPSSCVLSVCARSGAGRVCAQGDKARRQQRTPLRWGGGGATSE